MKIVENFKKLHPGAQIAIMLGGGLVVLAGGIAMASGDSKSGTRKELPEPGPGPTPISDPYDLIPTSQNIEYRGVIATIAQVYKEYPDENSPAGRYMKPTGEWLAVYTINGEKFAIRKRTNQSGIVQYFNEGVDRYFKSVKWSPVATAGGITMSVGGIYRLSVPANTGVAIPYLASSRVFDPSHLPSDWPATDRDDASRVRSEWNVSGNAITLPAIVGAMLWALTSSPDPVV